MAKKVLAACDGVITHIQNGKNGKKGKLGIVTLYNEEFNITFRYLHCEAESNTVEEGAQVKKGQHILNQGTTGTDATHLHFEVHEGNIEKSTHHTKLDPITYIPELLIWLDQTPSQHGNTDRSRDMETSYSNGALFSQRYIDQNKKDLLRNAFLLLKKRGRLGEIPTVTKRVLCENGLGDEAFCASTKFPVTTPPPTTTPVTQVSAPPTKKAKYPTREIVFSKDSSADENNMGSFIYYKGGGNFPAQTDSLDRSLPQKTTRALGGYPTTPYPDSLAASAPKNTDPDRYIKFWYGLIWGVIAQEAGDNPVIGGAGKAFGDLSKLDGGTAGIAHFATGGLKKLYKVINKSAGGGTVEVFGKQANNASTYDNLVKALKKNTTPSGENDNGTGPSTDDWWWNGMLKWLQKESSVPYQMETLITSRFDAITSAIEKGWKTDRQLAIAGGIANSKGSQGFREIADFHDWDEEATLESYKRKSFYVPRYWEYGIITKDDGHKTRRATAIDIWFPIEKQTDILEGGKLPLVSTRSVDKKLLEEVTKLMPEKAYKIRIL